MKLLQFPRFKNMKRNCTHPKAPVGRSPRYTNAVKRTAAVHAKQKAQQASEDLQSAPRVCVSKLTADFDSDERGVVLVPNHITILQSSQHSSQRTAHHTAEEPANSQANESMKGGI